MCATALMSLCGGEEQGGLAGETAHNACTKPSKTCTKGVRKTKCTNPGINEALLVKSKPHKCAQNSKQLRKHKTASKLVHMSTKQPASKKAQIAQRSMEESGGDTREGSRGGLEQMCAEQQAIGTNVLKTANKQESANSANWHRRRELWGSKRRKQGWKRK